jgi:hypothetical protein
MDGQKHLIECKCMLPQMKPKGILHKFVVFSLTDDNGDVITKFAQCNNCGVIHKVIDFCQSHIMAGKEHMSSHLTIEDIKGSLGSSKDLVATLERHKADLPTWECVKFFVEHQKWGRFVTLSNDIEEGIKQIKYLVIIGENLFKIETHMNETTTI